MNLDASELIRDGKNRARAIVKDLLSLEVNTIVKEGMTAAKMPPPGEALRELANNYANSLSRNAVAIDSDKIDGTQAGFDELHERAKGAVVELRKSTGPAAGAAAQRLNLFCRIRDTSYQLSEILKSKTHSNIDQVDPNDGGLDDRELLVVRKAWEVGSEEVIMQTVIYVDGDVITRLHPDYVHQPGWLEAHRRSVDVSISFWGKLTSIVMGIFGLASPRTSKTE